MDRMISASFPRDRPDQDQKTTFDLNVQELKTCNLVLSIVDGPEVDSGVAWEKSYAFAIGKHVVAVRTDFRKSGEAKRAGGYEMLYCGASA